MKKEWKKTEMAVKVWEDMAKKMKDLKITEIVFDRWGFAYHGRVKALAEALRAGWIKF
jgi:large subunit ribosomal protein L18